MLPRRAGTAAPLLLTGPHGSGRAGMTRDPAIGTAGVPMCGTSGKTTAAAKPDSTREARSPAGRRLLYHGHVGGLCIVGTRTVHAAGWRSSGGKHLSHVRRCRAGPVDRHPDHGAASSAGQRGPSFSRCRASASQATRMRSCPGTSLKAATVTLTISSALATPEVAAQTQRHQTGPERAIQSPNFWELRMPTSVSAPQGHRSTTKTQLCG
jgi:hypothetical protein